MPVTTDDLRTAIPSLYPDNLNGEIDAAALRSGQRLVADVIDQVRDDAIMASTDPNLAVQIAQRVEAASASAVLDADRAEAAADAAEDAVQYTYLRDNAAAIDAIVGMAAGETAFARDTEHRWVYSGSAWVDEGPGPTALKAPLASPVFTGVPTAPTASLGTSTNQIATTEFVADADASIVAGFDPARPFEATRIDVEKMILDADGREIDAKSPGFVYSRALIFVDFEATRDDLDRLLLDRDGRQVEARKWAFRTDPFESTRDLESIRLDVAGREILPSSSDVDVAEVVAARGSRSILDDRLSVLMDDYGASREPFYAPWAMREFRIRARKLLRGDATQLVLAVIGDSYTQRWSRYTGTVTEALWDAYGFAGCGYQSFGWFGGAGGPWVLGGTQPVGADSGPTHGSPWVQTQYSGAWTTAYNSVASQMPSLSVTSSSTSGDLIVIDVDKADHDEATLFYVGTGSGTIEVSWDNGATYGSPISLTGTGPQTVDLPGIPATAFVMRIRVASGSVSLGGVDLKSSDSGVRVHRLGGSGSRAEQWASVASGWDDMITGLAPNALIVAHGTNDQGSARSPATFAADVEAIAEKVLAVLPGCDVMISTPPENNRTDNPVAMTLYASAQRQSAVINSWAHLNYQQFFGSPADFGAAYASDNPDRPWFNIDGVHPEPDYPVMADALIRFLTT